MANTPDSLWESLPPEYRRIPEAGDGVLYELSKTMLARRVLWLEEQVCTAAYLQRPLSLWDTPIEEVAYLLALAAGYGIRTVEMLGSMKLFSREDFEKLLAAPASKVWLSNVTNVECTTFSNALLALALFPQLQSFTIRPSLYGWTDKGMEKVTNAFKDPAAAPLLRHLAFSFIRNIAFHVPLLNVLFQRPTFNTLFLYAIADAWLEPIPEDLAPVCPHIRSINTNCSLVKEFFRDGKRFPNLQTLVLQPVVDGAREEKDVISEILDVLYTHAATLVDVELRYEFNEDYTQAIPFPEGGMPALQRLRITTFNPTLFRFVHMLLHTGQHALHSLHLNMRAMNSSETSSRRSVFGEIVSAMTLAQPNAYTHRDLCQLLAKTLREKGGSLQDLKVVWPSYPPSILTAPSFNVIPAGSTELQSLEINTDLYRDAGDLRDVLVSLPFLRQLTLHHWVDETQELFPVPLLTYLYKTPPALACNLIFYPLNAPRNSLGPALVPFVGALPPCVRSITVETDYILRLDAKERLQLTAHLARSVHLLKFEGTMLINQKDDEAVTTKLWRENKSLAWVNVSMPNDVVKLPNTSLEHVARATFFMPLTQRLLLNRFARASMQKAFRGANDGSAFRESIRPVATNLIMPLLGIKEQLPVRDLMPRWMKQELNNMLDDFFRSASTTETTQRDEEVQEVLMPPSSSSYSISRKRRRT